MMEPVETQRRLVELERPTGDAARISPRRGGEHRASHIRVCSLTRVTDEL
jgi:hypothetical protein